MKKLLFTLCFILLASTSYAAPDPNFDIKAYCKSAAELVGGSAQIELACRDNEARDRDLAIKLEAPERAIKTCTEAATIIGGSYTIYYYCLVQEIEAIKLLGE